MAKSEGKEVREAYDGPSVEHDALVSQIESRVHDERARQSDAAESGDKLKKFLDDTGLNGQAFGWLKTIYKKLAKKNGQAKAMDVIRSLEVGLPMLKAHVAGQGSFEMDLDGPAEPADDLPEHHDADFEEEIEQVMAEESPDYDGDDEELAEESAEFLAEVDENAAA